MYLLTFSSSTSLSVVKMLLFGFMHFMVYRIHKFIKNR